MRQSRKLQHFLLLEHSRGSQETFPRSGGKKTSNYNKLPLPAPPPRHRHVNVVKTDKKVGDP